MKQRLLRTLSDYKYKIGVFVLLSAASLVCISLVAAEWLIAIQIVMLASSGTFSSHGYRLYWRISPMYFLLAADFGIPGDTHFRFFMADILS